MSPRYRKKPVTVIAEQFHPDKRPWPDGVWDEPTGASNHLDQTFGSEYYIVTLEGRMSVRPGDYVITSIANEKYPCRSDIFEATYEKIEEQS